MSYLAGGNDQGSSILQNGMTEKCLGRLARNTQTAKIILKKKNPNSKKSELFSNLGSPTYPCGVLLALLKAYIALMEP